MIEVIGPSKFTTLSNPGVTSLQIVWPGNTPDAKATITRVTVAPGTIQQRHAHVNSEQIWIIERGQANLLLAEDKCRSVRAGEAVRTPATAIHGVHNTGHEPFIYLAVTIPPADFRAAYKDQL